MQICLVHLLIGQINEVPLLRRRRNSYGLAMIICMYSQSLNVKYCIVWYILIVSSKLLAVNRKVFQLPASDVPFPFLFPLPQSRVSLGNPLEYNYAIISIL